MDLRGGRPKHSVTPGGGCEHRTALGRCGAEAVRGLTALEHREPVGLRDGPRGAAGTRGGERRLEHALQRDLCLPHAALVKGRL